MKRPKLYIAPNKKGKMIKIVMDVEYEPPGHKLHDLGVGPKSYTYQALIARFVNAEMCKEFFDAWQEWSQKKEREDSASISEKVRDV